MLSSSAPARAAAPRPCTRIAAVHTNAAHAQAGQVVQVPQRPIQGCAFLLRRAANFEKHQLLQLCQAGQAGRPELEVAAVQAPQRRQTLKDAVAIGLPLCFAEDQGVQRRQAGQLQQGSRARISGRATPRSWMALPPVPPALRLACSTSAGGGDEAASSNTSSPGGSCTPGFSCTPSVPPNASLRSAVSGCRLAASRRLPASTRSESACRRVSAGAQLPTRSRRWLSGKTTSLSSSSCPAAVQADRQARSKRSIVMSPSTSRSRLRTCWPCRCSQRRSDRSV